MLLVLFVYYLPERATNSLDSDSTRLSPGTLSLVLNFLLNVIPNFWSCEEPLHAQMALKSWPESFKALSSAPLQELPPRSLQSTRST